MSDCKVLVQDSDNFANNSISILAFNIKGTDNSINPVSFRTLDLSQWLDYSFMASDYRTSDG